MTTTFAATISLQAALQLPPMPNTLRVTSVRTPSLDHALAHGDCYQVDVGDLSEDSIEALCTAWSKAFRQHCAAARAAKLNTA